MQPVKAGRPVILFDVMDTLVEDPFYTHIGDFFGMTLRELVRAVNPTAWPEFERGELTASEYYAKMFRDGREFDHRAFEARIHAEYRWLDGMRELVARLTSRGYELHALSNYPIWYEMLDEKLELSDHVPWTFVSCRTGVRKPDSEAYLGAARALGVEPGDCLFIDDRPQNCAAAERARMPAIVFENADALSAELAKREIL